MFNDVRFNFEYVFIITFTGPTVNIKIMKISENLLKITLIY